MKFCLYIDAYPLRYTANSCVSKLWFFFDWDKSTLCLYSLQIATGSNKGAAKSTQQRLHMTETWDLEDEKSFNAFSVSVYFLFKLLLFPFISSVPISTSAQPASWASAIPGNRRQHFPTSKVHIDNPNLHSALGVKIIHTENSRVEGEGLSFGVGRIATYITMQLFKDWWVLEYFGVKFWVYCKSVPLPANKYT